MHMPTHIMKAGKVRNKLTQRQYENEVSWSTSTWLALQARSRHAQRLSVAVHT